MKVLSVVCARSGSKGLKNKCITKIKDKMVIEYSILYSLSLGENVKTVVSTDIDSVISYCKTNGVKYIERNSELCKDGTKIEEVLIDAIEKNGKDCDCCSLVYGNIPTRHPKVFYKALDFLKKNGDYEAVISMHKVGKFHPEWMFDYNEEILPSRKENHYRRQTLPEKMIHDGHTLIFRSEEFYKRFKGITSYDREATYSIFGSKIKPLINNEVIIDIDTERDLELAKSIIRQNQNREYKHEIL